MTLPPTLTSGEYARLADRNVRTVQRMIARGEFPAGSVVRVGYSKHAKHARLLAARLIEAGWLLPNASLA